MEKINDNEGCSKRSNFGTCLTSEGEDVLSREEFVFTIGYDGSAAVVDRQAKRKYGKLSTRELAEKGLFRAAYASALYSKDQDEIKFVAEAFNRLRGNSQIEFSEAYLATLNRLFGVHLVDVRRSIYL